jgi:hypothetical protein
MSPASDVPAAGAFVASNGELAWRRQDIEQALHVLRDSGQAILGGEVWLITGEKSWTGVIPQRGGGPSNVWSWTTDGRSSGESSRDYCRRTVAESVDKLRAMPVEQKMPHELIENLRFNLTYVAEPET